MAGMLARAVGRRQPGALMSMVQPGTRGIAFSGKIPRVTGYSRPSVNPLSNTPQARAKRTSSGRAHQHIQIHIHTHTTAIPPLDGVRVGRVREWPGPNRTAVH